jgi:cyclic pyranopterin phosphate synthase
MAFDSLKIDSVLMRGCNDGELLELVDFARDLNAEIRFIEYMDVAGATQWNPQLVVPQNEILERLQDHYGSVTPLEGRGSAPAQRFRLPNGQVIGIIASVTQPFCGDCDRLRVTADGQLLRCLYAKSGLNVRELLRQQPENGALSQAISQFWEVRRDQGAVDRSRLEQRAGYVSLEELRSDPHLEMHTRGG